MVHSTLQVPSTYTYLHLSADENCTNEFIYNRKDLIKNSMQIIKQN